MTDRRTLTLGADGIESDGEHWQAPGPWLGLALGHDLDSWRALLAAAAADKDAALALPRLVNATPSHGDALEMLAKLPPGDRPLGLLVSSDWQEPAAALCSELSGGALDLGLADAIRVDADGRWRGHHLLAGALEAVMAQSWPADADPASRASILGDGPDAAAAALAAVRRGATVVTIIASNDRARMWLTEWLAAGSDVLTSADITVTEVVLPVTPDEAPGLYVRVAGNPHPQDGWLPDAVGAEPSLLLDLAYVDTPPLGFLTAPADLVRVIAAGLASAWYLGLPVPWDALRRAAGV